MRTNSHSLLIAALRGRSATPPFDPARISSYVAMSLLQKAIRRGEVAHALRGAATLLAQAPEKLWRRLAGIAFEDLGIASFETIALTMAALGGKRTRASWGGEWAVASLVVTAMANATKCRAADDLLMSAELHLSFAPQRQKFVQLTAQSLTAISLSDAAIHERALSLWYLLGTDRFTARKLPARPGQPLVVFDCLRQMEVHETVVSLAKEGHRYTRSVLPVLVALLSLWELDESAEIKDDQLPPEQIIKGVPGWAYDMYSREGRTSLERFTAGSSKTAQWVRRHVPLPQQTNFLGGLVFRIEGGRCRQRLRWPMADDLRGLVDFECHGRFEAFDALQYLRADIAELNEARADVL